MLIGKIIQTTEKIGEFFSGGRITPTQIGCAREIERPPVARMKPTSEKLGGGRSLKRLSDKRKAIPSYYRKG
jgi:hypothetical protein